MSDVQDHGQDGRVDSGPAPTPRIDVRIPDEVRLGAYANFVMVTHTAYEFTLTFCQIEAGSAEEEDLKAEAVARVKLPPSIVARMREALDENIAMYASRHGAIEGRARG